MYCLSGRVVCIVCVGGSCVYCLRGRVVCILFAWEGRVCIDCVGGLCVLFCVGGLCVLFVWEGCVYCLRVVCIV